jgi:hypothetical protein
MPLGGGHNANINMLAATGLVEQPVKVIKAHQNNQAKNLLCNIAKNPDNRHQVHEMEWFHAGYCHRIFHSWPDCGPVKV